MTATAKFLNISTVIIRREADTVPNGHSLQILIFAEALGKRDFQDIFCARIDKSTSL